MDWEIKSTGNVPPISDAILIEGLPGIGNVGKVVVDFLIDELKAQKIYDFFSYSLPHTVFVNEENLVDLPKIELYHVRRENQHLLLLAGDVQPSDEQSSYSFSEQVLKLAKKFGTNKVITIGGIGIPHVPKEPKVYCTGNSTKLINSFQKGTKVSNELFGVVGPIVGVSGLLIGLSTRMQMDAVSFLAETYGHPLYIGVKGAREILEVLNSKLNLNIDISKIDQEIVEMETETQDKGKKATRLQDVAKHSAMSGAQKKGSETSYIG